MNGETNSLWRRSASWRWLTALAGLTTAIVMLARPWAGGVPGYLPPLAEFDPNPAGTSATLHAPAGASPQSTAASQATPVQATAQSSDPTIGEGLIGEAIAPKTLSEPGVYLPPVKSRVVWSNASGSVSGAGLIAEHCCSGGSSTVLANTPVRKGHHYWEVTLAVQPGEPRMGTNTNVGVGVAPGKTDLEMGREESLHYRLLVQLGSDPNFVRAIPPRNNETYQNGDVFMFALDADNNIAYYGVNGIWLNGSPGEQGGTQVGRAGDLLVPFVTIAGANHRAPVGDRWIANFGGSAFRYAIPIGYGAYGTNAPVTTNSRAPDSTRSQPVLLTEQVSKGGLVNAEFSDEFEFDGRRLPLPEGEWIGLAVVRDAPGFSAGQLAILGRLKKGRIAGMVVVSPTVKGASTINSCHDSNYLVFERRPNSAPDKERCWWVHYSYLSWPQKSPFSFAEMTAEAHGAIMPGFFLTVSFQEEDGATQKRVTYYFDPEEDGIRTPPLGQFTDQWRQGALAKNGNRKAFVEKIEEWARGWSPVVFAYR